MSILIAVLIALFGVDYADQCSIGSGVIFEDMSHTITGPSVQNTALCYSGDQTVAYRITVDSIGHYTLRAYWLNPGDDFPLGVSQHTAYVRLLVGSRYPQ